MYEHLKCAQPDLCCFSDSFDWGRPCYMYSKLRLGARLRGPALGLDRPTSTDNKADARGTHAADWV